MRLLQLVFLVALASGLGAIFINIVGFSDPEGPNHLSSEDLEALGSLRGYFKKCVNANGLGLQALSRKDPCEISMKFPNNTTPKWKDPKTGELEGLSFDFDLCEAVATWEQVRNSTTVLTREFIDALPNGWEEYAWQRINKGVLLNRCKNKTLCMEKLALVLPDGPPYVPRQFGRCAVIGNSGDLLKTKFGKEIDSYDAVLRENGAPIQNYSENVGTKSTFRLLNRGSAKALDKVAELYDKGKEVLIVKTTIHDIMNKMIQEIPILNPVYLMLGSSFGSAAKGTGLKALEFALSICDTVDMYGFTVDPGYKEWTRYFSESRQGHTPLHGRAYYQMMECLGVYGNGLIKSEALKRGLQNMESSDYEKLAAMKELENQLPEDEDDQIGQNDVFAQIIGPDRSGRVRMLGDGVNPSDLWGEVPSRSTCNRIVMEQKTKLVKMDEQIRKQGQHIAMLESKICNQPNQNLGSNYNNIQHTASSSNPLSIKIGSSVSIKSLFDSTKIVAKGVVRSMDPNTEVGRQTLGPNWCEIQVLVVLEREESLIRPYDLLQKVGDTLGGMIAWPCHLLTVNEEDFY